MSDELNKNSERAWSLLEAYLAGECSSQDAQFVRLWLDQNPDIASAARKLKSASVYPEGSEISFDIDTLYNRISNDLTEEQPSKSGWIRKIETVPSHSVSRSRFWGFATAATLLLVVGAGIFVAGDNNRFFGGASVQQYSTAVGQKIQIDLEDGTIAWLAPGTTLSYTNKNSSSARIVDLKGEAVFTVRHKEASPFIVRAGGTEARVLGTTFGVRYYSEDTAVRVVINDGKVAVDSIVLTPGDIAWVNASAGQMPVIRHNQQVSPFLDWRNGQLNFIATRFDQVLPVLSKWYDLEFVLADPSLASRELNATFETSELTAEDLDFISKTLGVRYLRIGRTVTFYSEEQ